MRILSALVAFAFLAASAPAFAADAPKSKPSVKTPMAKKPPAPASKEANEDGKKDESFGKKKEDKPAEPKKD